jgi:hypothetical protein
LNNVPASDFAVDALMTWKPYENTAACWNPLATTWKMAVICDFNSVGVQHYQNQDIGVRATANTLNQSYYDAIRDMLRLDEFDREALRSALATWGTCSGTRCDLLLNAWHDLWDRYALAMTVVRQPNWPVLVEGDALTVEIEIKNAGSETWKSKECYLANKRNAWGANTKLSLGKDTKHGETAVFSWVTDRFSSWGVHSSQWQLVQGEKEFGDTITINAIVLPKQLADKKKTLEEQVKKWTEEQVQNIERLVITWIKEQIDRTLQETSKQICPLTAALPLIVLSVWTRAGRRKKP